MLNHESFVCTGQVNTCDPPLHQDGWLDESPVQFAVQLYRIRPFEAEEQFPEAETVWYTHLPAIIDGSWQYPPPVPDCTHVSPAAQLALEVGSKAQLPAALKSPEGHVVPENAYIPPVCPPRQSICPSPALGTPIVEGLTVTEVLPEEEL